MQVEMVVAGLTIDPVNNTPIVILREKDGERVVPIWIGVVEASAIAFELESVKLTRPMTHDLLRTAVEQLGGHVERVVVSELRDNTYFALVAIRQGERTVEIDARPSDAIALALRARAPILCDEQVIKMARGLRQPDAVPGGEPGGELDEDVDRGEDGPRPLVTEGEQPLNDLLEGLDPAAFGKYKM
jgi:bifunctional DNase/RNase